MKYNILAAANSIFFNYSSTGQKYNFNQVVELNDKVDNIVLNNINTLIKDIFKDLQIELSLNASGSIIVSSKSKNCKNTFKNKGNEFRITFHAAAIIIPRIKIFSINSSIKNALVEVSQGGLTDASKDYVNNKFIIPFNKRLTNSLRGIALPHILEYCGNTVSPIVSQDIYQNLELHKTSSTYCYCVRINKKQSTEPDDYFIFITVENEIRSWEAMK